MRTNLRIKELNSDLIAKHVPSLMIDMSDSWMTFCGEIHRACSKGFVGQSLLAEAIIRKDTFTPFEFIMPYLVNHSCTDFFDTKHVETSRSGALEIAHDAVKQWENLDPSVAAIIGNAYENLAVGIHKLLVSYHLYCSDGFLPYNYVRTVDAHDALIMLAIPMSMKISEMHKSIVPVPQEVVWRSVRD